MPSTTLPAAATGLPSRRAMFATAAALGAALSLPKAARAAAPADHPDARLLALGTVLDRQEEAIRPLRVAYCGPHPTPEQDAAYEAADDAQSETTQLILAEPATTAEGFAVKARALAYIYHTNFTAEALSLNQGTTDQRLVWSILSGLLAIGGAS